MRSRKALVPLLLLCAFVVSQLPPVLPQGEGTFPLTMLVYRDGTVEFVSSATAGDLATTEGISSMHASLEVTEAAAGSRVRIHGDLTLEGELLLTIGTFIQRANFGLIMYPDTGYALFDFYLRLTERSYPFTEEGNTFYPSVITVRGRSSELSVDAIITVEFLTEPPYTAEEFNADVNANSDLIETMVAGQFAQMGYLTKRFALSYTALASDRSEVKVDLGLEGNVTEALMTTYPVEAEFSPILLLGAFVASPDDVSRLTSNLSSTGTLDFDLVMNYKGSYDGLINGRRQNYLEWVESIARQDIRDGEPWLPLIGLLKNAQLSAGLAGFRFELDYDLGLGAWQGRFPKMKVGQVSDGTVSLKQFMDALGALDPYLDDIGLERFVFAIKGVEDDVAQLDIVVPPGVPRPRSSNSSTGVWEGVYPDQLQDVTFRIRLKDTEPPVITPGLSQGATVSEKRPTLTATLSDNIAIDVSSVVLKLDGVDVTSAATVTSSGVSYVPTVDLQDGQHTFYVRVEDTAGNPREVTVNFAISTGIPVIYLAGGGVVLVLILGVVAFFLLRKRPSAPEAAYPPPPPPSA